ncbi:MAG: inner membrane protein YpjD [Burkholderiales bacterium]
MILSPSLFSPSSNPDWLMGATWVSALASLFYLAAAMLADTQKRRLQTVLLFAWIAHAGAIFFETTVWSSVSSGMPQLQGARFGFAPALSVTVWLVLTVYMLESRFFPISGMRRSLACLGVLALGLAWLFPGAVTQAAQSPWQPLHWILGIASYGLFGAAVLHGAMLRRADRQMRLHAQVSTPLGLPLLKLEQLTFRFVASGFAVLTLALLIGWWFSSPWRWDHKTVLSLLAWGVFAALLLGRQLLGWRGPVATRWLFIGAALLLLAYVGSRFVLQVILQRPSHLL